MEDTENIRDKDGQFVKGHKGLKPKGSLNTKTKEMKERLQMLMESYDEDKMIEDLKSLKPPDRLKIMTGLLEYILPKLNKTDYTLNNKDADEIRVELPDENEI
jgi:hypothetical protein